MIEQINNFFTIEMIYLWLNLGVLPFWIILFFFPHSFMSKYLVRSIFPFMIFSFVYVYLLYYFFISDFNFQNNFTLYLSLENLSDLFSENGFLIMFWCHFLAVNLFCGAWIVSDSIRLSISKFLTCNLKLCAKVFALYLWKTGWAWYTSATILFSCLMV